jgi:hypothetical protein
MYTKRDERSDKDACDNKKSGEMGIKRPRIRKSRTWTMARGDDRKTMSLIDRASLAPFKRETRQVATLNSMSQAPESRDTSARQRRCREVKNKVHQMSRSQLNALKPKPELPKTDDQEALLRLVAPFLIQEIELRNLRKVAVLAVGVLENQSIQQ